MANWQATLLNAVLTSGSVVVFSRDPVDDVEVPTVRTGDTFYGSVPDGDPFGGTFIEVKAGRAVVEVNQQRHNMQRAQHHDVHDDVSSARGAESWLVE